MSKEYSASRIEMETPEYKALRNSVFKRDRWTCQKCMTAGKKINCHHILRWADRPDLRYVASNCLTLCVDCHNMVTGHEKEYEVEFQRIIAQKKFESKIKKGVVGKNFGNYKKPKYKPRNPRNMYGW